MTEMPIIASLPVEDLVSLYVRPAALREELAECKAAAEKAAVQWQEEVTRVIAALDGFRRGVVHALGLGEDVTDEEIVAAAEVARLWLDSPPEVAVEQVVERALAAGRGCPAHGLHPHGGVRCGDCAGCPSVDDGPVTESFPPVREPRVFRSGDAQPDDLHEVVDVDLVQWSSADVGGYWTNGVVTLPWSGLLTHGSVTEVIYDDVHLVDDVQAVQP